jgi:tetratricopeptide (TPR) repeat protein
LLAPLASIARDETPTSSDALSKTAEPQWNDRSKELRKKVLGPGHPVYATSLASLARVKWAGKDDKSAEDLWKLALDVTRGSLGEEHLQYADVLLELANLYIHQGKIATARPLIAQATEITTGLIGTEHRRFVRCLSIEANLHRASGDDTAATKALRKALELSRRQVELASHVQSERQQLAMTTASRASLDSFLSVALDGGVSAEEAYGHVLAGKGSVFQRQRNARIARNEPELAPTLRELRSVSSRLATLALRAPKPTEAEAWRTRTDALREAQSAFLRGTIDSASVAKLRGPGKVKPRVKGAGLEVPPSVWAAWVLSGDWR